MIALVGGLVIFLRGSSMLPAIPGKGGTPPTAGTLFNSKLTGVVLMLAGLVFLGSTSFVHIDANRVGHMKRIFGFFELPAGRIIALPGQKGPQARVLGPGFHFIPFVHVLYKVEEFAIINVPDGYYGELTALDGQAMPDGMFIAPQIPDGEVKAMLDAEIFLTKGGYRGPQETVLKPGRYRLNHYLFKVRIDQQTRATVIPAGHVGVVKSNVTRPGTRCVQEKVAVGGADGRVEGALTVALVPKGCIGLWKEPLLPGAYYLNRQAYDVTLVDTRIKTWEYKGGYTRRSLELTIDEQGNIKQRERAEQQPIPRDAADGVVFVKIEGWDIPVELRVLVQIKPENAPIVVGSVGGLREVEARMLTPVLRSIVRNVAGSEIQVPVRKADGTVVTPISYVLRPTRVLDLIDNRESIERTIEGKMRLEGQKAGIEVMEVRIGEPGLPPELLFARKRVQLADQLAQAYARETDAQTKRTEREKARAIADEQPRLVAAQIAVQVADQREKERAALGRAERQFLEELARGQKAQALVLGQDRVAVLQALEKVLASLERKPQLVQLISRLVPHTVVGGGDGLAGAAAILGNALRPQQPAPPAVGPVRGGPRQGTGPSN
ncbi:MAG: SPFH domain-containing protein [Hyphomicrobiaceae bacterium]